MIRCLLRLTVFPVIIILTILEWCGTYMVCFTGMLCKLVAGTIFVLSIVSYLMGLAPDKQIATSLVAGLLVFILPKIAGIMVSGVALANTVMVNLFVK